MIFDARVKPHHAPPLIPDKTVSEKVDKLFSKGGPLYDFSKKVPYSDFVVLRPEALSAIYVTEKKSIVPNLLKLFSNEKNQITTCIKII